MSVLASDERPEGWWGGWVGIRRSPGVRLNGIDLLLVGASLALAAGMARLPGIGPLWAIPPYVMLGFLLFCNVFRIPTRHEIAWCVAFAGASAMAIAVAPGRFWWIALPLSEAARLAIVVHAVRTGRSRGLLRRMT